MEKAKVCPNCGDEHENKRSEYCCKVKKKKCVVCSDNFETKCNTKEKDFCNKLLTKKCLICNDEFNTRCNTNSRRYCSKTLIEECAICEKEIETKCNTRRRKLCSTKCTSVHANNISKERKLNEPKIIKTCEMCGDEFEQKEELKDGVIGCSPTCRFQIRNGPRNCNYCKSEYYPKTNTSKVCSFQCSGKIAQSEESKKKRAETNIKRLGVENPFSSKEVQEKIKNTMIERYDVENPLQNKEIRKKVENTVMKRYNVKHPLQNKDILNKMINTNMKRHDVMWTLQNPKVKKKAEETLFRKHGVTTPFASAEIRAKAEETNFKNHGVRNPFQRKDVQEKAKKTIMERYYSENFSSSEEAERRLQERNDKMIVLYNDGKTEYEIAEVMKCEYITVRRVLLKNGIVTPGNITQINKYWAHLIKGKLGVKFEHEGKIFTNKRMSVDLYNDELKIAIDINPTITHSTQETPIPYRKTTKVKYHQDRAIDAQENGWELIQIFDWDCEEDIIELLHSKFGLNKRIYARKCSIKEITNKESKDFLNRNHRQQGKANSSIQYGLFYKDELVQVMTFSKERFSRDKKEDNYELLRLTSKRGFTVVGGASKLLTAFQKSDYKPQEIKTFADFSKGTGSSYEKIGMTYEGFANMNAFYSNIYTNEAYKVTEITNKFRKEYSKLGMTQKEYMNSKDFYRINDAGHKIFRWKNK